MDLCAARQQAGPALGFVSCYHAITVSLAESSHKRGVMADKFIKDAIKKPGALRKSMGAKKGEPIDKQKMSAKKAELEKKAEGDKKLTPAQRTMLQRINLAETLGKMRKK